MLCMCLWHGCVLLVCIKGIERGPCLGQWVGLGRGDRVGLVCAQRREGARVSWGGGRAPHIWLALSEVQLHIHKLC